MGGTADRAEGTWDETKGKVKQKAGEVTDDESLQAEGYKDEAKGEGKQAMGKAKDKAEDAKERIKESFD